MIRVCGKNIKVRGRLLRIARLDGDNISFWTIRRQYSTAWRSADSDRPVHIHAETAGNVAKIRLSDGMGQSGGPAGIHF